MKTYEDVRLEINFPCLSEKQYNKLMDLYFDGKLPEIILDSLDGGNSNRTLNEVFNSVGELHSMMEKYERQMQKLLVEHREPSRRENIDNFSFTFKDPIVEDATYNESVSETVTPKNSPRQKGGILGRNKIRRM